MKGNRKFYGFILTAVLYTAVLFFAVLKGQVADVSAFAVQSSVGYCGIAGLFFTGNVLEHFASKGKGQE